MGKNGNAVDIDEENIFDRISMLEDDMQILETETVELLAKLGRLGADLKIIKKYTETRRP